MGFKFCRRSGDVRFGPCWLGLHNIDDGRWTLLMWKIVACLVSLLIPSVALAAFGIFQVSSPPSTIFQADTTKSISSITPAITCLQSGTLQTPAFIQCSASGTTASGSSNPYIDLQYVWTDNNGSPDSFTLPSPIGTRSSSLQYGPEYVQVFRAAGTYTVTLTVKGCTTGHPTTAYTGGGGSCASNAITTAQTTQTVTVSAFVATNDYFFDASTGNDANVCSSGSPCQHPSKCATLLDAGSNNRCNFNCGQTFDGTTGSGLNFTSTTSWSHNRVQAAGTACPGATPIISIASGGNTCINIAQNGSGGIKSDFVISSLACSFTGTASSTQAIAISGANTGAGQLSKVYLDNLSVNQTLDVSGFTGVNIEKDVTNGTVTGFDGIVVWNVSTTFPIAALGTASGILGGSQFWYAVVGGTQQGSGAGTGNVTRDHHVYMHCGEHCLARWVNTGPTCTPYPGCTPTRDSCIKSSYDPTADGDGPAAQSQGLYWLIDANFCVSVANLGGPGNNTLSAAVSTIDQYIAQQNVLNGIAVGVAPVVGQNIAIRDNWACLTGLSGNSPAGGLGSLVVLANVAGQEPILASNIYRNFVYSNRSFDSSNHNPLSTYYILSAESYTLPQRIFDNIFQTDATNNFAQNIPSTNFNSISSFVDYNTYYAPNNAGNFLQNADTGVSFAAWKVLGWDAHGVNANPGFSSPSTCGFGAWPY